MVIEIDETPDATGFHRVKVDGHEQIASAIFLDLSATRRSMSVWNRDDERAALAFVGSRRVAPPPDGKHDKDKVKDK